MEQLGITFADVVAAHNRLKGVAYHTSVLTSTTANTIAGAQLFFKCENFQRVGAFKFRGAYNAVAQFTEKQLAGGVMTFSSGNHAQAIALAAKLHGTKSVILMPSDAPEIKVNATRYYGGEVVFYDRYKDDREAIGLHLVEEQGLTLISPYDHPHVIAGQGTSAKEFIEDTGQLDVLIAPIGGGGLLSGCAIAAKNLNPKCLVIGVEPEAGNDAQQSFKTGQIVHIDTPKTIADGAQTRHIGKLALPILRQYVDEIVTVSDAQIIAAMKFFAARMKIIVEPTGCLAAAAVFANTINLTGKKIGIILSGGNIDLLRFASLIQNEVKMSDIQYINADSLSSPKEHYSYSVCANGFVFISGLLPIRPDGSKMSGETFIAQAKQVLSNLDEVLRSCATTPSRLLHVRVYLSAIENWAAFNNLYATWIGNARPARCVVPVPELNYGLALEIEAIAMQNAIVNLV